MDREVSDKYLTQQIMSATPARLVAMLYDRAIMLLHDTISAIEAGDIERRWKTNNKAMEIVAELWQALDMENGGEIAANLNRLYGFITMRLTMIDLENDAQAARDVIKLLEPLRQSWHKLAENNGQRKDESKPNDGETPIQITLSA